MGLRSPLHVHVPYPSLGALLPTLLRDREALEEVAVAAVVEELNDEVLAYRRASLDALSRTLDERQVWAAGAQQVRALMFVERFAQDLDRRLEALGQ